MPFHPIVLEEWELLNLDHKCSTQTQRLINEIKKRIQKSNEIKLPKQVESLPGQKSLFE